MLKIAYFGSDLFSLVSFREVLRLREAKPHLISDVQLVTRQLKVSGRGMKNITKPQIVQFAESQKIPWHEVESIEEFGALSSTSNLAIAVSYGKLIPSSFLTTLKYGGLNVHPSLLPQFRGASPLQYAIMDQCKFSGVSVQTLHPTKFDHGKVLWQSEPIELHNRETTHSLSERLSTFGAEGLVNTLESMEASDFTGFDNARACPLHTKPSLAPLIDRHLHKIDFNLSAEALDARGRALGKLFFEQVVEQKKPKRGKPKGLPLLRVNLSEFVPVDPTSVSGNSKLGEIIEGKSADGHPILCLKVSNGFLGAAEVTVQGFKPEAASAYFEAKDFRRLKEVNDTSI